MSKTITIDVAELRAEIKAVRQCVELAEKRLEGSITTADAVVAALQDEDGGDAATRLLQAKRNAARLREDGGAALSALRKAADSVLATLGRQLKLAEVKIASR